MIFNTTQEHSHAPTPDHEARGGPLACFDHPKPASSQWYSHARVSIAAWCPHRGGLTANV